MANNLWADNPELQAFYDRVSSHTRRLQKELGIEPLTLEQRYQIYLKRKAEEELENQRRQKELEVLKSIQTIRRLPIRR